MKNNLNWVFVFLFSGLVLGCGSKIIGNEHT